MALKTKVAGRILKVLHVEDNPGDAALLKEVLKRAGFPVKVESVETGEEALQIVGQEGRHALAPRPDVVLLDLKLPRKDGLTILTEMRQKPHGHHLPIIILTSSDSERNIDWSNRLRADHYVIKPLELSEYSGLVKLLRDYWLKSFRERPQG